MAKSGVRRRAYVSYMRGGRNISSETGLNCVTITAYMSSVEHTLSPSHLRDWLQITLQTSLPFTLSVFNTSKSPFKVSSFIDNTFRSYCRSASAPLTSVDLEFAY